MMQNLSMTQALSIWSDLEAAYYQKNDFGGDTAEIYIDRAMPYSASTNGNDVSDLANDEYDLANESLHDLFTHFSKTRNARIEVAGSELGSWLRTARFEHRVHVKVTPK